MLECLRILLTTGIGTPASSREAAEATRATVLVASHSRWLPNNGSDRSLGRGSPSCGERVRGGVADATPRACCPVQSEDVRRLLVNDLEQQVRSRRTQTALQLGPGGAAGAETVTGVLPLRRLSTEGGGVLPAPLTANG